MSNEDNTPTLDNDVEKPARSGGGGRRSPIWGLMDTMEVGQSFFTPVNAGGYLAAMNKETDKTFSSRSVTEGDVEGTRVWRDA